MAIEDIADRSESAVDESEPMIMMKNTATRTPGRYSAATCGRMLLGSPSTGSIPAYRASTPTMPMPMIVAP